METGPVEGQQQALKAPDSIKGRPQPTKYSRPQRRTLEYSGKAANKVIRSSRITQNQGLRY